PLHKASAKGRVPLFARASGDQSPDHAQRRKRVGRVFASLQLADGLDRIWLVDERAGYDETADDELSPKILTFLKSSKADRPGTATRARAAASPETLRTPRKTPVCCRETSPSCFRPRGAQARR